MSLITIANVRTAIGDTPRRQPVPGQRALVIGVGDGVSTLFFLPTTFIYNGVVTLYQKTATTNWIQVDPLTWTFVYPDTIAFTTPPADTIELGASFLTAAFSDSDILQYLTLAQRWFPADDALVLKKCQYDFAGNYLMDSSRLRYLHEGDFEDDPAIWARSMNNLRKELIGDLTGKTRANLDLNSVTVVYGDYDAYVPPR